MINVSGKTFYLHIIIVSIRHNLLWTNVPEVEGLSTLKKKKKKDTIAAPVVSFPKRVKVKLPVV